MYGMNELESVNCFGSVFEWEYLLILIFYLTISPFATIFNWLGRLLENFECLLKEVWVLSEVTLILIALNSRKHGLSFIEGERLNCESSKL